MVKMKDPVSENPELRRSNHEQIYEERRKELIEGHDLKMFIDEPMLLARRQRVTKYLTLIKLFEKMVVSIFLCKIFLCQFFKERQIVTNFSYRV